MFNTIYEYSISFKLFPTDGSFSIFPGFMFRCYIIQWNPLLSSRFYGSKSPYEILGVKKGASQKEIRDAYLEKSKLYHPDSTLRSNLTAKDLTSKFQEINEAYKKLSDPLKKAKYDNTYSFTDKKASYDYYKSRRIYDVKKPDYKYKKYYSGHRSGPFYEDNVINRKKEIFLFRLFRFIFIAGILIHMIQLFVFRRIANHENVYSDILNAHKKKKDGDKNDK